MSTPTEQDDLDPDNPMYFAPRRMREEAKSPLTAPNDISPELSGRSLSSPSFDTLITDAVSKSLRELDPVTMHEPPGYPSRWRELIPFAAAVGAAALAALFFVFMIPVSRDHSQDSNAPSAVQPLKAAVDKPAPQNAAIDKPAPREDDSRPAIEEFKTILATDPPTRPAEPAVTHEQSDALLQQFVRWQQKRDSTDAPAQ